MAPKEDVRAFADWTVLILRDELSRIYVKFLLDTRRPELLNIMIYALTVERKTQVVSYTLNIGGYERGSAFCKKRARPSGGYEC